MLVNRRTSSTSNRKINSHEFIPSKVPHDFVFTRWMGTWEHHLSLWSNRLYADALLGYIGKIYGQQANVYHYFNRLWNDSLYSSIDELDLLHTLIQNLSKIPGAKSSLVKRQATSRIESRFNEIKAIIDTSVNTRFLVSSKFSLNELIDRKAIDSYFDLGCGNGLITTRIGNYLKLNREQIFGGDVFDSKNSDFTFVSIDQNQSKIDLADQCVSLVTCLVTLHHVPDLERTLKELARITRRNGYLIIREHDCRLERSLITKYLNFIHAIMMIAHIGEFSLEYLVNSSETLPWVEEKKKIIQYTKSIQYQTRQEWQKKFESAGFDLLATYDYDLNKTTNPQRLFYAVYKRNDKPCEPVIDEPVK